MAALTEAQRGATVISTDTKPVKIGDLLGKPLVLAFFPAAFSGTCTKEMCAFRDSIARFNAVEAQVYGISVDLPYTLAAFAEQQGLTYPLLSDANREAIRAFDVVWPKLAGVVNETSNRAVFVIDPQGEVVYAWTGGEPRTGAALRGCSGRHGAPAGLIHQARPAVLALLDPRSRV